ncbi:hypothetical protein HPG69_019548 [Diceros bicornis minor]|uniref:Uncharacterized protein n=1 Tax=Diceros bicornis minor TaxID=77932 RepID=A0A7J7E5U7_DICBM|nr:hypothetical protein HPG69_019548 [Diceros bicornis minor]
METHIQVRGPARGKEWAHPVTDKKEVGPLSKLDTKDVHALLKKSEAQHKQLEDCCSFGTLMQCLLQAWVEGNVVYPKEDSHIPDTSGKESGTGLPAPLPTIITRLPGEAHQGGADLPGPAGVSGPQRTQRIRSLLSCTNGRPAESDPEHPQPLRSLTC